MSQPEVERLGSELVVQSARLVRAVRRALEQPTGVRTLSLLDEHGPSTVTQLAHADRCSQPTMTGIVRRLEQDGLVRRTADPADARAVRVALTDAGRDELAAVRSARAAVLQHRLDRLDDDARAALAAALDPLDDLLSP